MEEKVMQILSDICGAEEGELEIDTNLFEMGVLDSFGVIQLVLALEENFDISLEMENLTREDISTPAGIVRQLVLAGNR